MTPLVMFEGSCEGYRARVPSITRDLYFVVSTATIAAKSFSWMI